MSAAQELVTIFDVQRFCLHDGPGIRTVVFFKGCPLRCVWCQNPESLDPRLELACYAERCAGCGACVEACPNQAVQVGAVIDRPRCQACGACTEACPHEALRLVGRQRAVDQLAHELARDLPYFEATGGGVTLSGGEPLLQISGAAALLAACKGRGIHSAVQTCGAVPWERFERALPHVDLFLFDLKAAGDGLHHRLTGWGTRRIADNARRLVESGAQARFRMPVVPGINDTEASLAGVAELLRELGQGRLTLMPYHAGGESKLGRLDSQQPLLELDRAGADAALDRARGWFERQGVEVLVEGHDHQARVDRDAERRAMFPSRVWQLRQAVQAARPAVCAERALLITEYFRAPKNRAKPMVRQKAEALAHVLGRRRAVIYPRELLVGCFSTKRVGGGVLPELHGVAMLEDLLSFDSRQLNPLHIDAATRRALATRVLPFWSTRFLALRAFPPARALGFVAHQLRAAQYVINETGGISHIVPDYAALLSRGTRDLTAEARQRQQQARDPHRREFYGAVARVCQGLEELARPYAAEALRQAADEQDPARRAELERMAEACQRVPALPARTMHEALQSLLLAQIAINLESLDNSVCPGRLDQLLLPYYQADLAAGRLDEQGARDLIGCFTVKMSEIVPVFSRRVTRIHGGLFNGQVVVVGGTDDQGHDATNELTWILLDAMDALRMRQPNFHARVHAGTPPEYLERVATMLRDGSAAPSLVNDEVVVPMLVGRGTELADARDYSPVGCVEPVSCGKTMGSTDAALVNLPLCLERALGLKPGGAPVADQPRQMDQLVAGLTRQVEQLVHQLADDLQAIERANALHHPTPLTSTLLDGCLQSGVDSTAGGARYNGSGVQAVGLVDLGDSLAAVDRVVFRRRLCDLPTLVAALRDNFATPRQQQLRGHLLRAPKFGNHHPADDWTHQVMQIFAAALARHRNTRGGAYWAGFYSVTAHQAFGRVVGALPSGRPAGAPLANGLSPATGMDRLGPSAALSSVASLDLARLARNGVNVNLKLDPAALAGPGGAAALAGLVRGYFHQGGMQLQLNVMDPALLLEARDDPAAHPWLLVRVSGYSAYFNDLSSQMKQELIERRVH